MDYMPLDEGYDFTYLYIAYVSLQGLVPLSMEAPQNVRYRTDRTKCLEADPRPGGRPYAWRPTLGLEADPRPGGRP